MILLHNVSENPLRPVAETNQEAGSESDSSACSVSSIIVTPDDPFYRELGDYLEVKTLFYLDGNQLRSLEAYSSGYRDGVVTPIGKNQYLVTTYLRGYVVGEYVVSGLDVEVLERRPLDSERVELLQPRWKRGEQYRRKWGDKEQLPLHSECHSENEK